MTKHQKVNALPNLDRRSFIIGTAAAGTGLVLGYAALPEVGKSLAAAGSGIEPTVWASISNDGKVWVTVGKADMGQHIGSTMAQLVAEELEAVLEGHGDRARFQRSEIQRSGARRPGDRRQLEHGHEL